jgi:hypothetical protein
MRTQNPDDQPRVDRRRLRCLPPVNVQDRSLLGRLSGVLILPFWMVTEGASRRRESTRGKWTTVRPPSKTKPAFSSQLRRFAVLKNSVFRFLPRKTNPRQSHRRRFSTHTGAF